MSLSIFFRQFYFFFILFIPQPICVYVCVCSCFERLTYTQYKISIVMYMSCMYLYREYNT